MSYEFQQAEPVPEGIKRVVAEEIENALEQLKNASEDRAKAVHNTRKGLKKVRSVLRLVRRDLGKKVYTAENRCFGDVGRSLSDVRDADVLLEAFDNLTEHFSDRIAPREVTTTRKVLLRRRDEATQQMFGDDQPLAEAISTLEDSLRRVPDWPLQTAGWDTLGDGMKFLYKQGRHAMQLAYSPSADKAGQSKNQSTDQEQGHDETSDETFHDWRKRVKDLWYHTLLLGPVWPDVMRQFAKEAHQLSDDLGDDHDLAVLREALTVHHEQIKPTTLDTFTEAIEFQRARLQQRAYTQGQHLYAEKPSAYVSRLEAHWQAWRA